jgi:hypothetical protein
MKVYRTTTLYTRKQVCFLALSIIYNNNLEKKNASVLVQPLPGKKLFSYILITTFEWEEELERGREPILYVFFFLNEILILFH